MHDMESSKGQSGTQMHRIADDASKPVGLLVVDDHPLVCLGVAQTLKNEPALRYVAGVGSTHEMAEQLARNSCHLVLLDFDLSPQELDGLRLVRMVRARFAHLRIVVMLDRVDIAVSYLVRHAGAHGIYAKSDTPDILLRTIKTVMRGESWFPQCDGYYRRGDPLTSSRSTPPDHLLRSLLPMEHDSEKCVLSPNEFEVIRCSLLGLRVSQIAEKLARSPKTISAQKRSAFRKLGINSDQELFRLQNLASNQPPDAFGSTGLHTRL
jgi:two-component system, NarL family, captular synthesis response regulator RcsB